jgi:hypothetical protein
MNIRVDLNYPIQDGTEVVFRSPVDCSQVTGLKVYYGNASQEFVFADAHGNNVGDIDHLFAENVVVKVILDVTTGMAFVQNADTNAYLEGRFSELEKAIGTGGGGGGGGTTTDGFSPIAKVTQTAEGVTIEITDKDGTTTATVTNGKDGAPGKDYVLTEADKEEIAGMVPGGEVPPTDELVQAVIDALPVYDGSYTEYEVYDGSYTKGAIE